MRLIIDLTDVLLFFQVHSTVSGIQRYSLRTTKHILENYGSSHEITAMAIDAVGRVLIGTPDFLRSEEVQRDQFIRYYRAAGTDDRKRSGSFRRARQHVYRAIGLARGDRGAISADQPIAREISDGDLEDALILACGGMRPIPGYWERMDDLKRRGATIVMTVHDLIPIIRSELVHGDQPKVFYSALHQAARSSDRFIAVSETTKRHLSAFLETYGYPAMPVDAVPLAHEFAARVPVELDYDHDFPKPRAMQIREKGGVGYDKAVGVRDDVKACGVNPFVLSVGTNEPRKNLLRLCRVWQTILQEVGVDQTPHLVLAGKKSYGREEFDEFLRTTESLGGRIKIIDAPTDYDLSYLYRNCLFTVFPSLAEGWGLPVGESLWHGKLCVASNAWAVPEVGGPLAAYFDPNSSREMFETLLFWIRHPEALSVREKEIRNHSLRSWKDVAEDVWRAVSAANAQKRLTENRIVLNADQTRLPTSMLPE